MPFWKVRAGAVFAHEGRAQKPGTVLELPRRIANEFNHVLDECTPAGTLLAAAPPAWLAALETIPAHENVDVLKDEREQLVAQIAELRLKEEAAIDEATTTSLALVGAEKSLVALDQRIEAEIAAARTLLERRLADEAAAAPPAGQASNTDTTASA